MKNCIQFHASKDWPKKRLSDSQISKIDVRLQNYFLSPKRLGSENRKGSKFGYNMVLEKLFLGEATEANEDESKMILGFFWFDRKSDSVHQVQRTREYPFMLGQFPEIDPYKKLHELADSYDQMDFWRRLEVCVQNRTKESKKTHLRYTQFFTFGGA